MNAPARTPTRSVEVPGELFHSILSPYRKECVYLRKMWIDYYGEPGVPASAVGGEVVGRGQFCIPESFYINGTGHFNAVEFNLCYNQLGYIYLAYCFDQRLIAGAGDVDLAYFKRQQLGGVLIAKFASAFHSQMQAGSFWGEFSLPRTVAKSKLWLLDTHIRYWDDGDGRSDGDVLLAILKETPGVR